MLLEIPVLGLHVRRMLFEPADEELTGCADDLVDLGDLVQLVPAVEQRVSGHHLKKHAPITPDVHLVTVVALGHEALGGSVPPGRYVLGVGQPALHGLGGPEVSQLDLVPRNQHILWLEVAMENTLLMSVGQCLQHTVHVVLHALGTEVLAVHQALVQVLLHELEHEGQLAAGLIVQDLDQLDDIVVGVQGFQNLYFWQSLHVLEGLELLFHAFYGNFLPRRQRNGPKYFRKGTVPFFLAQPVLVHMLIIIKPIRLTLPGQTSTLHNTSVSFKFQG